MGRPSCPKCGSREIEFYFGMYTPWCAGCETQLDGFPYRPVYEAHRLDRTGL